MIIVTLIDKLLIHLILQPLIAISCNFQNAFLNADPVSEYILFMIPMFLNTAQCKFVFRVN